MRWFRHDSTANRNAKLEKVLMKYGGAGYGLYWLCLELIADRIDSRTADFELRHDAEILALRTKIQQSEVEEIMLYMIKLGLFENTRPFITCLRMADMIENQIVKNPQIKALQEKIREKYGNFPDNPGKSRPDEIKLDETKLKEMKEEKEPEAETASSSPASKKPEKKHYGEFQKVTLTDDEFQKLGVNLGEAIRTAAITKLDTYMAAKGKNYKSCYAAIGSWVIDDLEKRGVIKAPITVRKWWEDGEIL